MQREAQGDDLDARLEAEDADEVGLRVVLRKRSSASHRAPAPRPRHGPACSSAKPPPGHTRGGRADGRGTGGLLQ